MEPQAEVHPPLALVRPGHVGVPVLRDVPAKFCQVPGIHGHLIFQRYPEVTQNPHLFGGKANPAGVMYRTLVFQPSAQVAPTDHVAVRYAAITVTLDVAAQRDDAPLPGAWRGGGDESHTALYQGRCGIRVDATGTVLVALVLDEHA